MKEKNQPTFNNRVELQNRDPIIAYFLLLIVHSFFLVVNEIEATRLSRNIRISLPVFLCSFLFINV